MVPSGLTALNRLSGMPPGSNLYGLARGGVNIQQRALERHRGPGHREPVRQAVR
jgi:hypothetical protein